MYKLYKDVLVRTNQHGGTDREMVRDCINSYSNFSLDENSRVLDLGANIGGFSVMCDKAGVKQYVGIEADEENYSVILENNKDTGYEILYGACSDSNDDEVTFYIRKSKRSSCSGSISIKNNRNLESRVVKNYNIDDIIDKYSPDCLKIDIEGAEVSIFDNWNGVIPDCVNELALEIHGKSYIPRFEKDIHPIILENFDLITSQPAHGFINKNSEDKWNHFGHSFSSVLFGFDLFYRRKNE